MLYFDSTSAVVDLPGAAWILAYATVDVPLGPALDALVRQYPGVPVFGCTSFLGVFTPNGFPRGFHTLNASQADGVRAFPVIRSVGPARARTEARAAAAEIRRLLGDDASSILMHATPGFEERVLEGIDDAFVGAAPPVYGGSAADDDMSGKWKVFSGNTIVSEGFLLVGFKAQRRVLGSFVGGYTPTHTKGVVTSVVGRMVETIDNRPAAKVYNEWTHGLIEGQLSGGAVLSATALRPLGRAIDKIGAVQRYLLSHPHLVRPDGALWFFSELKEGDELVLMLGTESALVERANQVAARALAGASLRKPLAGAILTFCGGCVAAIHDKTVAVADAFRTQIQAAPFVGGSTFGEQGCFPGKPALNRHGNLMCNTVMFEG